ncbi:MAG: FecR domain-containing protein [Elusimicrobia bacterium]|nr:FecR domain-containing protein [Elusimicrobiota bacterium]
MGIRCTLCALALAAGLAGGAFARERAPVCAVATAVEGSPRLEQGARQGPLKTGQFLRQGDVVRTREGDLAAIAMLSGVEVRINGNTVFDVVDGGSGDRAAELSMKAGQVWTRLMNKKAAMKVNSILATMSIRGTEADLELANRLAVRVYEGHVELSNKHGRSFLDAGNMAFVMSAAEAPEQPRPMSASDHLTWQNGINPKDAQAQLEKLREESKKQGTLEFKLKSGKGIKLKLKPRKEDAQGQEPPQ